MHISGEVCGVGSMRPTNEQGRETWADWIWAHTHKRRVAKSTHVIYDVSASKQHVPQQSRALRVAGASENFMKHTRSPVLMLALILTLIHRPGLLCVWASVRAAATLVHRDPLYVCCMHWLHMYSYGQEVSKVLTKLNQLRNKCKNKLLNS